MVFILFLIAVFVASIFLTLLFTNPAMFIVKIFRYIITIAGLAMVIVTVVSMQQLGVAWAIVSALLTFGIFAIVAFLKNFETKLVN